MNNREIHPLFFLAIGLGGGWLIAKFLDAKIRRNPKFRQFSSAEAKRIGEAIGINWSKAKFPVNEFRMGLSVELEHGTVDSRTNVTDDDLLLTGKIAWVHLNELTDYYTRLEKMEEGTCCA